MSSKGRNFRRRGGDDGDDDEDTPIKSTPTNTINGTAGKKLQSKSTTTASKPKLTSTPAPAPKSLLSFADDEEAAESAIPSRRSSSTARPSRPVTSSSGSSQYHKLTLAKERTGPSVLSVASNVQPQAGTYTKEALLELQKNTRTLAPSRPARTESKPKSEAPPAEPVVILKGLLKPTFLDGNEGKGRNARNVQKGPEESDNWLRRDRDEAIAQLGSMGLDNRSREETEVSGSGIPDKATIEKIRAKREALRQARPAAPDYISLDGGSNHGEAEGLSDEEPEFQRRIGFFGEKIENQKKGVFEDFEERALKKDRMAHSDDDDEDEEDKIWEEEQVRKGLGPLGKRLDDGDSRGVSSSTMTSTQTVHQQKVGYPDTGVNSAYSSIQVNGPGASGPTIGGVVGGFHGMDAMSRSQQADLTKKAFYENMRRLKESHDRTEATLLRTDENLSSSLENITRLEDALDAAGKKFLFMQKLGRFVSVICAFLQEKAPFIEELEDQMRKFHEERAKAISERRAADDSDEMKELEAAVEAAMSVFRKDSSSRMIEAARSAAQAASASARERRDLPVHLDEYGRDENLQKQMDITRRAEARQRRREKSDSRRLMHMETDSSYQLMEGESSTDESDSESNAYESNCSQLLQIAEQIFSDASDKYAQFSVVVEKFDRWKKEYSSSYRDAYMSLSAPAVFSPYVRLELLKWNPLHEDGDFINMKWHSLLFNYGLPEDGSDVNPDDADANLVPELVEKLAVPILHHHLKFCWDVFSVSQTKYAVSATNIVLRYVPLSSSAVGKLLSLLRGLLSDAVKDLTVPTWNTFILNTVPKAARAAAYRFGMSVRLMRNICMWNHILAMPILEKIALDDLFRGKVLPHLTSIKSSLHDAITRCERIVASLDGVWSGPSVTGDRSPKLQPLVDYVLTLGETLKDKHTTGGFETETTKLARRLKKMLVDLNEYDHARRISRTFNLKEAL